MASIDDREDMEFTDVSENVELFSSAQQFHGSITHCICDARFFSFFINFSNLQMLNHCYKFDRNNSDSDEVDGENVSILFHLHIIIKSPEFLHSVLLYGI